MQTKIPLHRKALFTFGSILTVCGIILFLSNFIFIKALVENGFFIIVAPVGMVLIIIGAVLRTIGSKGLAGSGITLNPEQAREDLKPHSKALGGILSDVVSETPLSNKDTVVIKVKCKKCGSLNDEASKYCNQCGEAI